MQLRRKKIEGGVGAKLIRDLYKSPPPPKKKDIMVVTSQKS